MKRRSWWLALVAPQAAAQEKTHVMTRAEEYLASFDSVMGQSLRRRLKPANDQCPVCGTMAPARKDQTVRDKFGAPVTIRLPEGGGEVLCWITRCTHCNAAFWQDSSAN